MANCGYIIDKDQFPALSEIIKKCEDNNLSLVKVLESVMTPNVTTFEFTNAFQKEYNKEHDTPLDMTSSNPNEVADAIIKYYKQNEPIIAAKNRATRLNRIVSYFGYDSIASREFAKRETANIILELYKKNIAKRDSYKNYLYDYVLPKTINSIRIAVIDKLTSETNLDAKELKENLGINSLNYIQEIIDNHPELSQKTRNTLALYGEITSVQDMEDEDDTTDTYQRNFIKGVFNDSRLQKIGREDFDRDITDIDRESSTLSEDLDNQATVAEATYDDTISIYESHLGSVSSFSEHISSDLKMELSLVPKLTEYDDDKNGKPAYDRSNPLGLKDVHDANQIASILYSQGAFYDSPDMMIDRIDNIAKTLPGFAGLKVFASKLRNNVDLRNETYVTFTKMIFNRTRTNVSSNTVSCDDSNTTSSALDVLRFSFINSFKTTSLDADNNDAEAQYKKLFENITKLNNNYKTTESRININDDELDDTITTLSKIIGYYLPITEQSIRLYIKNNKDAKGNVNKLDNLLRLTGELSSVITCAKNVKKKYKERQKKIRDERSKCFKINNNGDKIYEESEELTELYYSSYTNSADFAPLMSLSKELLDYSVVNIDLNSTNPHGNQSSSVLNNNMISNLMHILNSALNESAGDVKNSPIMQFLAHRMQSQQFDFSNILIERREGRNIINRGLFRLNKNGDYEPTPYARHMLRYSLFDGASNKDTGDNILFDAMSYGDYVGTAWANYFNEEIVEVNKNDKFLTAEYFLRIPADAKNIFTVRAPRYDTSNLRVLENANEILEETNKEIARLMTSREDIDTIVADNKVTIKRGPKGELTSEDVLKHLRADGTKPIKIAKIWDKSFDRRRDAILEFEYKIDEANTMRYVVSGTYENGTLYNAKFEGFRDLSDDDQNTLVNSILRSFLEKELNRKGVIGNVTQKFGVNKNHVVFKQFRNAFIQEILDAVVAEDAMFDAIPTGETDENGNMIYVFSGTVDTIPYKVGITNEQHDVLTPGYHYAEAKNDGDPEPIIKEKDGLPIFTGRAFKSNKFTIYNYDTNSEKNYGQEIIDESIDFLYGGAITDIAKDNRTVKFVKDAEGKIQLKLSQEQVDKINAKLEEFINDYIFNTNKRLLDASDFINSNIAERGTKATVKTENTADFILNYRLAYFASDELLEGNSKYYKNAQTQLKREKAYQASGSRYAIGDFLHGIDTLIKDVIITEGAKQVSPTKTITLRRTFTGVTIKNSIKTDKDTIDRLVKKLVDDCGLTKERAEELMKGYAEVITNDAQSYITLDECVRRIIGRGQYDKYKSLIEKLYDENSDLTEEDFEQFVQVQKNVYFDLHYNKDTKAISPRFIKNAELVLVPKFIKGTALEYVNQLMEDNGIDQLNTEETSKAAKGVILEVFDSKTGELLPDIKTELDAKRKNPKAKVPKSIFNQKVNIAKEAFDYNYLYTQQETKQHVNDFNKAGIQLMKKIIDNINANSDLFEKKGKFFKLYTTNIKESFEDLMDEFNIMLDDKGNLKVNELGEIPNINYEVFYSRLEEELSRLGMTSNMMDYVTLIDKQLGTTRMPSFDPLVAQKLENVAQAVFNNYITKQMLPGFHAAQVSNVGFQKVLYEQGKSSVEHNGDLKYHPMLYKHKDGKLDNESTRISEYEYNHLSPEEQEKYEVAGVAPYVEIMLPASSFGINRNSPAYKGLSKEEQNKKFLNLLRINGLDKVIGYRIPTEGKQSICLMKVVGFVDDAQGSTIVVPDMWVAQTGSDFDIDTVYGIQKNLIHKKDGTFEEYKYYDEDDIAKDKTLVRKLYFDYLRKKFGKKKFDELLESRTLHKDFVKNIFDEVKKDKSLSKKEIRDKALAKIREESNISFIEELTDAIKESDKTILTYKEFSKLSVEEQNSRKTRENKLIDTMMEILSSDESLEETLSRSNFEKITKAKDDIYKKLPNYKKARDSRSPYDFLDQALYHVDASSGMKLKGFSVVRDNLCSIFNTCRAELTESAAVDVIYTFKDKKERDAKLKELQDRFAAAEKVGDNQIKVTHKTLGNTKDNRNVEGYLLTPFSSQTTAFCLDVMKAGNIPNVNEFTFGVFKTFADIGSDYHTAESFIMLPGVTEIVKQYESTNSIYTSETTNNHIQKALYSLIERLGTVTLNKADLNSTFEDIMERYGKGIRKLFGDDAILSMNEDDIRKIPFNYELQMERLTGELTSPVEEISNSEINTLYDIVTCLQYYKLSLLSDELRSYGFVLNLDKSGAKQTLFETRKIFENIKALSERNDNRIYVGDKKAIDAIYPRANEGLIDFINSPQEESAYAPAYTFLRFVTAPSILVNRKLFITQNEGFLSHMGDIESMLSFDRTFTEKEFKEAQNYTLSALYKITSFINTPLNYTLGEGFNYRPAENNDNISRYSVNLEEQKRIYGYDHNPDMSINEKEVRKNNLGIDVEVDVPKKVIITDVNNPSQTELDLFAKLSPAQKVKFIQLHFEGDYRSSIFSYLDASLHNDGSTGTYAGRQTIQFNESISDLETVYNLFYQAFTSDNPLIAMTAMDLVKYSYVVEGRSFRKTSVSKIIKNDVLITDHPIYGTGIVDEINYAIQNINTYCEGTIKENFIRSHSTYISTRKVFKNKKTGFEIPRRNSDLIIIPRSNTELLEKYGITYTNEKGIITPNSYINLTFDKKTILYKIKNDPLHGYILIPLNKLESNENDVWSANPRNNTHPRAEYYEALITAYTNKLLADTTFDTSQLDSSVSALELGNASKEVNIKEYTYTNTTQKRQKRGEPLYVSAKSQLGEKLVTTLNEWYDTAIEEGKPSTYIVSSQLSRYLPKIGDSKTVIVKRTINGEIKRTPIRITKINVRNVVKDYIKGNAVPNDTMKDLVDFLKGLNENWGSISEGIDNIYKIEDASDDLSNIEGVVASAKTDFIAKGIDVVKKNSFDRTDTTAKKIRSRWKTEGVYATKVERMTEQQQDDVIAELADYITEEVKKYTDSIDYFRTAVTPDVTYSIDSKDLINIVKRDEATRINFLKTLQEANRLLNKFQLAEEIDITSENPRTNKNLQRIREALQKLGSSDKIRDAKKNYIQDYVNQLSNNPLVKQGLIDVVSGFYTSDYLESLFNDIQETPNPFIQSIMKETMTSLRAAEMQARRDVDAFKNKVNDIIERAQKAGTAVDFSNIYDEYGREKQAYNKQFEDDKNAYIADIKDAKEKAYIIKEKEGYESTNYVLAYKDYLTKLLEYREWKAKYTEQPIVQEYYDKRNKSIRDILIGHEEKNPVTGELETVGASPYIYTIYEILKEERALLRRQVIGDEEDKDVDDAIESISEKINSLQQPWYIEDGEPKQKHESIGTSIESKINNVFTNATASLALSKFIHEQRDLYDEYYQYDVAEGFFEECDKCQKIIDDAEKRVNGIPTASAIELQNNIEYIKAQRWLKRNARKRIVASKDSSNPIIEEEDAYKTWVDELKEAKEILYEDNTSIPLKSKYPLLRRYTDVTGEVDVISMFRDYPDEAKKILNDIKSVRTVRNTKSENTYSPERIIRSIRSTPKVIFTKDFYANLCGIDRKENNKSFMIAWNDAIGKINELLAPFYSSDSKTISFVRLLKDDNAKEILTELKSLFDKLDSLQKLNNISKNKEDKNRAKEFIESTVHFDTANSTYEDDLLITNSSELGRLFKSVIQRENPITGKKEANRYLYSIINLQLEDPNAIELYLNARTDILGNFITEDLDGNPISVPNISEHDLKLIKKYVDKNKTLASRTIEKYTAKVPTAYYYLVENDVRAGNVRKYGYESYNDWFNANHFYNSNTRTYEPLSVWTTTTYTQDYDYMWEPLFPQQVTKISDGTPQKIYGRNASESAEEENISFDEDYNADWDKRNPNYKSGSILSNYKGGFNEYDSGVNLNSFEQEMKDLIKNECLRLATTDKARRRINEGWMPNIAKIKSDATSPKFWGKEMMKFLGFNDIEGGYGDYKKDEEVDYANDEEPEMPLLVEYLENSEVSKAKIEFEREFGKYPPHRKNYDTEEAYQARLKDYNTKKAALDELKKKTHKELRDDNVVDAVSNFILQATHYNTVQKLKYQLFFAKEVVENYGVYEQQYGKYGSLKTENNNAGILKKTTDTNLLAQLSNTIRRIVYDQWKESNGAVTKYANVLQSFTSAKFMMFNLKGGVANVTVGESQMWAEAFAREFLGDGSKGSGVKILNNAMWEYSLHSLDYMAHMNDDKANTVWGAIIKFFDVVNYDEHTGLGHLPNNAAEIARRIREKAYFQQTMGEHFMQNSMMFGLLESNIIIPNDKAAEFGQPAYKIVDYNEFIAGEQEKLLKQLNAEGIITHDEMDKYVQMKEEAKNNANVLKEYAWFKSDLLRDFRRKHLDESKRKKFIERWNERKEKLTEEFKKHPTVMSQLELGKDGKLTFKAGSELSKLDIAKSDGSPTNALQLLAQFKGKIISVNKKIHGVYDKTGRAQIEKTWIGGLIMQYHKHLPMGILKRYRNKGYFNEERGAIEKGMYRSLIDFLGIQFKDEKSNSKSALSIRALKNYITQVLNFNGWILNYRELPEYDKANLRRMWGDILFGGAAIAVVVGLRALAEAGYADDDDNLYNFFIYQADRLNTEALMYSFVTLPSELKKNWMSPVAGFNGLNDLVLSLQYSLQYLFDDEFEMYYTTGRNAGRHKIGVRLENNIPLWRGIKTSTFDMSDNNKYYKVGQNFMGMFGVK